MIIVEENYDIGGRGMLSGGRVQLGGGHALQQKFNIKDNADQVFLDWVRADDAESRYSDRDLVRVYADENVATYQFLLDNGVEFIEKPIGPVDASTRAAHLRHQGMAHPGRGRGAASQPQRLGAGAAAGRKRAQEGRADPAQAQDDADHPRAAEERQACSASRCKADGKTINIRATKGVIIATGGHTGNVNFRRMFDPRLTEEYQQACQPYVYQNADGEIAAMDIGASLWATAIQTTRERRRDHQDAPHRLPLGLRVAGLRDRQRRCSRRPRPPASP